MKIDHWQHVSLLIRAQIDISEGKFDEDEDELDTSSEEIGSSSREFRNIVLGAKQKPHLLSTVELSHSQDPAFKKFQDQFCKFLSVMLPGRTASAYKSIFAQEAMVC